MFSIIVYITFWIQDSITLVVDYDQVVGSIVLIFWSNIWSLWGVVMADDLFWICGRICSYTRM
jgi:hypothetical protein